MTEQVIEAKFNILKSIDSKPFVMILVIDLSVNTEIIWYIQ
jgi:hypothetical protein